METNHLSVLNELARVYEDLSRVENRLESSLLGQRESMSQLEDAESRILRLQKELADAEKRALEWAKMSGIAQRDLERVAAELEVTKKELAKYLAFWEQSRLVDQQIFEMYEWNPEKELTEAKDDIRGWMEKGFRLGEEREALKKELAEEKIKTAKLLSLLQDCYAGWPPNTLGRALERRGIKM